MDRSVYLSIYLHVYRSISIAIFLSIYPSVFLSIYLPVCLSICIRQLRADTGMRISAPSPWRARLLAEDLTEPQMLVLCSHAACKVTPYPTPTLVREP